VSDKEPETEGKKPAYDVELRGGVSFNIDMKENLITFLKEAKPSIEFGIFLDDLAKVAVEKYETEPDSLTDEELAMVFKYDVAIKFLAQELIKAMQRMYFKIHDRTDKISERLGLNKARLHPIKPDTPYIIFTENMSMRVKYDHNFVFYLEKLTGDGTIPSEGLKFIGNVQIDGAVFHAEDLPIFSTGDKLLFADPSSGKLVFITTTLQEVIEEANVN